MWGAHLKGNKAKKGPRKRKKGGRSNPAEKEKKWEKQARGNKRGYLFLLGKARQRIGSGCGEEKKREVGHLKEGINGGHILYALPPKQKANLGPAEGKKKTGGGDVGGGKVSEKPKTMVVLLARKKGKRLNRCEKEALVGGIEGAKRTGNYRKNNFFHQHSKRKIRWKTPGGKSL